MKLQEIIQILEDFAPLQYQESYDNCGLQVGDISAEIKGVLLSLDVTEAVLEEAIAKNCNLIIAHHPLIFSGIKKLNQNNTIQKIIYKAIKNEVHIYAMHTNLDNLKNGVNAMIAKKLGLINCEILQPKENQLFKLQTFVPVADADGVLEALFEAGAGAIGNYSECSFSTEGKGSFRGNEFSNPTIGNTGGIRENVTEVKIEVLLPQHLAHKVVDILIKSHPYEVVAYDLIPLLNKNPEIGAGMIGELEKPMPIKEFLQFLKDKMSTKLIRHTKFAAKEVKKIAFCGGSGSFLLQEAIKQKADVFITGDFKYHQFFEAENKILIADIGHFESEQFTPELIKQIFNEKNLNFAVLLSQINTNPINYFF